MKRQNLNKQSLVNSRDQYQGGKPLWYASILYNQVKCNAFKKSAKIRNVKKYLNLQIWNQ